jgi:ABC-type Fe2+-enterobactin transport system substrate-binding protein
MGYKSKKVYLRKEVNEALTHAKHVISDDPKYTAIIRSISPGKSIKISTKQSTKIKILAQLGLVTKYMRLGHYLCLYS